MNESINVDSSSWSCRAAWMIPSTRRSQQATALSPSWRALPASLVFLCCRALLHQLCYPVSFSAQDFSRCHGRNTEHAFVFLSISLKLQITTWKWICLVDLCLFLKTWLHKHNRRHPPTLTLTWYRCHHVFILSSSRLIEYAQLNSYGQAGRIKCPLFTLSYKRHSVSSFYSLWSFLLVHYPFLLHFILPHFLLLFSLMVVSWQWHICWLALLVTSCFNKEIFLLVSPCLGLCLLKV